MVDDCTSFNLVVSLSWGKLMQKWLSSFQQSEFPSSLFFLLLSCSREKKFKCLMAFPTLAPEKSMSLYAF